MAGKVPSFDELMNPLLRAMQALGGSGSVEEIYDKVVELERFPDDVVAQPHDPEKSNQTELGYRLAWARTYLKKYGLLENSNRGIWALTAKAKGVEKVNPQDVVRAVRGLEKEEEKGKGTETAAPHEVSQQPRMPTTLLFKFTHMRWGPKAKEIDHDFFDHSFAIAMVLHGHRNRLV